MEKSKIGAAVGGILSILFIGLILKYLGTPQLFFIIVPVLFFPYFLAVVLSVCSGAVWVSNKRNAIITLVAALVIIVACIFITLRYPFYTIGRRLESYTNQFRMYPGAKFGKTSITNLSEDDTCLCGSKNGTIQVKNTSEDQILKFYTDQFGRFAYTSSVFKPSSSITHGPTINAYNGALKVDVKLGCSVASGNKFIAVDDYRMCTDPQNYSTNDTSNLYWTIDFVVSDETARAWIEKLKYKFPDFQS
jgi:hypothetical protein